VQPALLGNLLPGPEDHRSRTVDQQGAQIAVAPLADAQQGGFATTGMLPGNEAQPGSELPCVVEALRIPKSGDQGACRDRADARNLLELATVIAGVVPGLDLPLHLGDLAIEFLQMVHQSLDQQPECASQLV